MLPKRISKRQTVSFRVDCDTWKFIEHLKHDKFIDVSSWMRAVLSDAIDRVKKDGAVSYGHPESISENISLSRLG